MSLPFVVTEHSPRRSSPETQQPYPYPPPILIKHSLWFLSEPDLYVSIRGLLYGLHQQHFTPHSTLFQQAVAYIEPGCTTPRGLTPTLPIPLDTLDPLLFEQFLLLLYHPDRFRGNENQWKRIHRLATHWNFRPIMDQAFLELQYLRFLDTTPNGRRLILQYAPRHIRAMFWRRYFRTQAIVVEASNDEMDISDNDTAMDSVVGDDSA